MTPPMAHRQSSQHVAIIIGIPACLVPMPGDPKYFTQKYSTVQHSSRVAVGL